MYSFLPRRALMALVVPVIAAALLVAPAFALDPAPNPGAAQIETDFLTGMIPHHRSAVEMAQMALDKSTHPELRQRAQNIIDSQTMEIAQMTQWLHDWYGMEPPSGTEMPAGPMMEMMPMLHGRMPDMAADMQLLQQSTGADFEVAFMDTMSRHHAMAVMMTGPVLMGGHHADLMTRAEDIAISQGQEIQQMDQWLQAWYGLQRPLDVPTLPGTSIPAMSGTPMPDMPMGH